MNAIHAKRPVSYSFEELYRVSTSLHESRSTWELRLSKPLHSDSAAMQQSCLARLTAL